MAIKDGEVVEADDLLNNLVGDQFKNWMNLIWNSDYIGWNAKLNYDKEGASGGTPGTSNLLWDNFTTTGAAERDKIGVEETYGLEYDATNDVYYTTDLSTINSWVIIEADDATITWTNNNCELTKIASGRWLLWNTEDSIEVERAQIHKSLWWGSTGTNQLIDDFTNVTAIKTSTARDVGKKGYYINFFGTQASSAAYYNAQGTYTFDAGAGDDVSSWALVTGYQSGNSPDPLSVWYIPKETERVNANGEFSPGYRDEMGTDMTADEVDAPADFKTKCGGTDYQSSAAGRCQTIILAENTFTLAVVEDGPGSYTNATRDFFVDDSIPAMIVSDTLVNEGAGTGTLISNDVATAVTNGIPVWNATIDAGSTQTGYLSADNGSNWEEATEKEIARLSNAGSNFKFKWSVARTDISKNDTISAFGVLYSLGAGSG